MRPCSGSPSNRSVRPNIWIREQGCDDGYCDDWVRNDWNVMELVSTVRGVAADPR